MKQGKRLTRKQREILINQNVNYQNWLVTKNLPDRLELVHKETGTSKIIYI